MRRRLSIALAAPLVSAVAAALGAPLLLPAPASGQVAWQQCADPGFGSFQCGRVTVRIDRSGGVPGTIDLFARRLVAPQNPNRSAIVYLSGGPGQSAAPLAAQVAQALAPGLNDRDLLAFDQRGTGSSHPLRCDALRRNLRPRDRAAQCANEIGPQRAFFRTPDSVADIEDLRAAAGYEQLVLMGTSYGTKVALAYAARHPDRVERLILDSVVTPEGPDPLARSSFRAAPRILRSLCAVTLCRRITPDPVTDVARLVARRRVRGRYVTARGRIRRGFVDSGAIYTTILGGDTNPAWRALLPGALRAAARGDESPLLRLASTVLDRGGAQAPGSGVNDALFLTTICEELPFPWDRAAGPDQRTDQAVAAINGLPTAALAPFDRDAVASAATLGECIGWPNASPAPERPGELPRVPALVLAGEGDLRTPLEDAVNVAGRLGASAVVVPHTGHSVLGGDFSGCATAAVAAFFRDGSTPACPAGIRPPLAPLLRPPRSLREVPRARRYGGRVGRTLNAVALTQSDALTAGLGAQLDGLTRVAGVRRGTIAVSDRAISLRGVELVPGVRVTGSFPSQGNVAHLRITGRAAARGRLRLTRGGTVTGRLGGRRIRARPRAAAARRGPFGGPPQLRELFPFPALRTG
jgi:pimeloyl-ACP methyl ester carboxylesterase